MTDLKLADVFEDNWRTVAEFFESHNWPDTALGRAAADLNTKAPQIIAALRRGHEPEREFSPFWLIERGQAVHHKPTIWWKGGDVRTWPAAGEDWKGKDWTENAPEARRFKTREEALQLAKILFGDRPHFPPSFSITEHSLIDKPERPPSGERYATNQYDAIIDGTVIKMRSCPNCKEGWIYAAEAEGRKG